MLADRMSKPNNTVRNHELKKQYEKVLTLKHSISRTNKLTQREMSTGKLGLG